MNTEILNATLPSGFVPFSGAERRGNWITAQIIDEVVMFLRQGGRPYVAKRYMDERLIPQEVQLRVFEGKATVRHKRLVS